MTDFLLELRSEEIPARMQEKASADLVRLFAAELAKAGLAAAGIEGFVTPRRLALIARGLPETTQAVSDEIKGPRASAPPQALEGFLRKTGLSREELIEREGVLFAVIERAGRSTPEVLAEAIPAIVRGFPWPKSMRWGAASLSTESPRWVRPLQGIVALFGEEVVPFAIAGIESGATTVGHRFHHPGPITIGSAADYAEKLNACHVIVDADERRRIVREGAQAATRDAGLALVPDEGLVAENAGLTEWPVPLLGRFDPAFLAVPREVIQLTMRTNQKYFACVDAEGALAPAFVCTANIEAVDGGAAIVAGNAKVLAARLADARFFWEQDLKVPLADQARKLDQIVFHEKLGTVADKVERVAKLARWLVEERIISPLPEREGLGVGSPVAGASRSGEQPTPDPSLSGRGELADMAEQAARLCKADLVTGMVGEFPELQGVMGGYYARHQGLPDAVADAIRDHYKPVGQGDEVPTAPVTVAVSLADKLDTIVAFFTTAQLPSGSKDPYALRRSAISILRLIQYNSLRLKLRYAASISYIDLASSLLKQAYSKADHARLLDEQRDFFGRERKTLSLEEETAILVKAAPNAQPMLPLNLVIPLIHSFFADRLKVQQREAGARHDLIDAVFALGGEDDLVRLLARVKALQAFVETAEGADLLAGYRRAANILRAEAKKAAPLPEREGSGVGSSQERDALAPGEPTPSPSLSERGEPFTFTYTPDPAEAALADALDAQLAAAETAIAAEDFAAAMAALSALRPAIDAFFDEVTVNDADPAKRANRLALLEKLRAAMHNIADFSKIEG